MDKKLLNEIKQNTGGRDIVFVSLFGSHNYGLVNEHSDKDYKVFVAPTFKDLMEGTQFHRDTIGLEADYIFADIRNFPTCLYKTSINFLETLFSLDYSCEDENMNFFIDNRDSIARMNLRFFYKNCLWRSFEKNKRTHKFGEKYAYMEEKYGYNVKVASYSLRILETFRLFMDNGFQDFSSALRLQSGEYDFIKAVKNGEVDESTYNEAYAKAMLDYKNIDIESLPGPNEELFNTLKQLVYEICRRHICD